MMSIRGFLSVCAGVILSIHAVAGEISLPTQPVPSEPTVRVVPHAGGWWNESEGGSGYFLEFMRNADGTMIGFGTIYTYNADGTSTFLIVQGPMTFANESTRVDSGIFARFSSTLFKAANGQPFGGAYRPADVTPAGLGDGEFVFFTRQTGEFRGGGRAIPIRAIGTAAPRSVDEYVQLLTGTWALSGRVRMADVDTTSGTPTADRVVSHVVSIELLSTEAEWGPGVWAANWTPEQSAGFWKPPVSGVLTFRVRCVSDCPPVPYPGPAENAKLTMVYNARIWVDPMTGRAGYVTAGDQFTWASSENLVNGAPFGGSFNWAFDLFVDNDTLIARGGYVRTLQFLVQENRFYPNHGELVLTRTSPRLSGNGTKIY